MDTIRPNTIIQADCRAALPRIAPDSIALAVWSPPYHLNKSYEAGETTEEWLALLSETIRLHQPILKPGGFLCINIADILAFPDPSIPPIMAEVPARRKISLDAGEIRRVWEEHPEWKRQQVADYFGCSEQTVDRRLRGNNARGKKHATPTRVRLVAGDLQEMALAAGLYPYDRRVWVKDPAWANSRWVNNSYRSVDEFEYLYFFWKPGLTRVQRERLTEREWAEWGSRAVWYFPSVRANHLHEAMFPAELPRRVIRLLSDPGDTILDAFLGSGTTALTAAQENRQYIGIERDERYCALARSNLLAAGFQPG